MSTRLTTDYLLTQLISECAEIIHAVTKAQQFGLNRQYPERKVLNIEQIAMEIGETIGVVRELMLRGILDESIINAAASNKINRMIDAYNTFRDATPKAPGNATHAQTAPTSAPRT
jgi:hypothetical protein